MIASDRASRAEYEVLNTSAGVVDFSQRSIVGLSGDDRASFLHNLSTNEIRKLPPDAGCEAFLTTVQAKILAHLFVFADADQLVLETVPGQAEKILAHLDRYQIREKVVLTDRTTERAELLLAGPLAAECLGQLGCDRLPAERLASVSARLADSALRVRRVDLAGPIGFLLEMPRDRLAAVRDVLAAVGAKPVGPMAFDAARIEAGFPLYGRDLGEDNLPQEVAREAQTISFVKGCYLGQETVARIDALGHVNKSLVGVRLEGEQLPDAGSPLSADGKPVGQVTSASYSPRLESSLALAYVRRGHNRPGARLEWAGGAAEVIALPLA